MASVRATLALVPFRRAVYKVCVKSLEAATGTGHKDTHTHWTPAAKKARVRPTTPSAVTLLLDSEYDLRREVRGQDITGSVMYRKWERLLPQYDQLYRQTKVQYVCSSEEEVVK